MSDARTPIWFIKLGGHEQVAEMTRRLMDDGFLVNAAAFPAVPRGGAGIRFMQSLHHSDEQIESLIEAIARHVPQVVDGLEIAIDLTGQERASAPNRPGGIGAS